MSDYRCVDCTQECRRMFEISLPCRSGESYPQNINADCIQYSRKWWKFWRPQAVSNHNVTDHPGKRQPYYQAACPACGWEGCSCQLIEERFGLFEDSAAVQFCPECESPEVEAK